MNIVNIIILIAFLFFLVVEGKEAVVRYQLMKQEMNKIKETKEDVEVHKDYMISLVAYSLFGLFILVYGIYFAYKGAFLYGSIFIVLALFCIIFMLETVVTRTAIFYDNGLLLCGKAYKYKNVLKIEYKKKFLRGYQVKVMGEDEVYVSKKIRPFLEARLEEHKNRKKK